MTRADARTCRRLGFVGDLVDRGPDTRRAAVVLEGYDQLLVAGSADVSWITSTGSARRRPRWPALRQGELFGAVEYPVLYVDPDDRDDVDVG